MDYSNLYGGAAGLILYAVMFVLGYMLVPNATFQRAVVRYRTLFLALAVLLLALHEFALGAFGVPTLGGSFAMPIVRLLRGLITWCLIVSALGYAARYWTAGTRLLGSLSEACFPLYVLHMPDPDDLRLLYRALGAATGRKVCCARRAYRRRDRCGV